MIVQGEIYQIKWKQSVFQIANCLTKNEEWDLSKIDFSDTYSLAQYMYRLILYYDLRHSTSSY